MGSKTASLVYINTRMIHRVLTEPSWSGRLTRKGNTHTFALGACEPLWMDMSKKLAI